MSDLVAVFVNCVMIVLFVGLCARVAALHKELRKQGDDRAVEAKRIADLLRQIKDA